MIWSFQCLKTGLNFWISQNWDADIKLFKCFTYFTVQIYELHYHSILHWESLMLSTPKPKWHHVVGWGQLRLHESYLSSRFNGITISNKNMIGHLVNPLAGRKYLNDNIYSRIRNYVNKRITKIVNLSTKWIVYTRICYDLRNT